MCIQGRLEVHLRVERPDILGRRDILRIHTRSMKANGALAADAQALIEDLEQGLPALTEYYSGAEIAGVVRSAASFALARNAAGVGAVDAGKARDRETQAQVTAADLTKALSEITAMAGRREVWMCVCVCAGAGPICVYVCVCVCMYIYTYT